MTKLTPEQWKTIRAEREAGATFGQLAERHGTSKASIVARSTAEGWTVDPTALEAVRRKTAERVIGLTEIGTVTGRGAKSRAIEQQADAAAALILKHRRELEEHRQKFPLDLILRDFDAGKSCKISVEAMVIRQNAERRALGLDRDDTQQTVVIDRGPVIYLPDNGRG